MSSFFKKVICFLLLISLFFTQSEFIKAEELKPDFFGGTDQPYRLVKNEVIKGQEIKKLLLVTSLEPPESPFYQLYQDKVDALTDIISSHWEIEVTKIDVGQYQQGQINQFEAVYFLEEYGRFPPYNFFKDLLTSTKQEIIWSGYGAEELVAGLFQEPLFLDSEDQEIKLVEYKGEEFFLGEGRFLSSYLFPDKKTDLEVVAWWQDKESGKNKPFALDIEDRFLIFPFEVPFRYSIDNFSLVYLDLLHRAFGHHEQKKLALLRLEDIEASTYRRAKGLSHVYQYLKDNRVPFHLALIARYKYPGKNVDFEIGDRFFFQKMLKKMVYEGWGTIVQHGYTHQVKEGISGTGFEFWDEEEDKPLEYDSVEFVQDRVKKAREIMSKNSLPVPDIWETPHYALSQLDDEVINSLYPLRYGDLQEYNDLPFTAQIGRTIYFPENLSYIYDYEQDLESIKENLAKLSVFEDPVASFFWHPWRDKKELEILLRMFWDQNYHFVSVYDLVDPSEAPGFLALAKFRQNRSFFWRTRVTEIWIGLCFGLFSLGIFMFIKSRYQVSKHLKKIRLVKVSIRKLEKIAASQNKQIPRLAIFVPARNEGLVIENTIRRLVKLYYPKDAYKIVIITDARELDDQVEVFTRDIVLKLQKHFNTLYKTKLIEWVEVPKWYSGYFKSLKKTFGESSKGRALNYALQKLSRQKGWQRVKMIGILDADGRLDRNVLREVAYKSLTKSALILQGPVFQISNFSQVSFIGIMAGLELSIHHLTQLARQLLKNNNQPQFLAGTNYFIDAQLMIDLGGWDTHTLVEDAELALRAYVKKGVVARWLSWPEIEQTPPSFAVYRRQRDRWVRGQLDLIPYIKKAKISFWIKLKFISQIYLLMFRVFIDLGIPVLGWLLLFSGVLLDLGPFLRSVSYLFLTMSFFIWDFYGFMYRKLTKVGYLNQGLKDWKQRFFIYLQSIKLILWMPVFIVAQSIPRVTGAYKYLLNIDKGVWYKTERSKEKVRE
ncbi:DUF2334 domain-containing protein [Patescibacteria group bacterium]